ncbi:MAG TPA: hypothetical protein VGJ38_17085 [Jatrophihabitantaceae bacterium]
MSRRTPRWTLAAACVALVAAPLLVAVATATPAAATTRCSPVSSKYIGGTLIGQDGRDINAQIGLAVVDKYGKILDLNGCRTPAYTVSIWMNKSVSGNGAVHTSATTRSWRLSHLPANAVKVWIEVWTRTNLPKSCASCDGPLDTHRYGFVNRRAIPVNKGTVRLMAPLHCGLGNGSTGTIQGTLTNKNGTKLSFGSIHAWSMLNPDGSKPLQGWGQARRKLGYYVIDALASGQDYVVWASYKGHSYKRYHVMVKACQNVPLRFVV